MLAIALEIKLYQNKRNCFMVLQTQPKVSGMGMSTCVVRVVVHFFFDRCCADLQICDWI